MDTKQFLNHVLPKGHNITVAHEASFVKDGEKISYQKYVVLPSVSAAAEWLHDKDNDGTTVYHINAALGDWFKDENGKSRIRTQDNVEACRSIYDDFDVDPGKTEAYASKKDAMEGIKTLFSAIKITPTIVDSGGGFHAYITCEDNITPDQWFELSRMKRDINRHLGVKSDPACDTDSARVLRPVGTHNRKDKYPEPRLVKALKVGKHYPYEVVYNKLRTYIDKHNVPPAPSAPKKSSNMFAGALGDHPPSDADKIAEHCAAIRNFKETGCESEQDWYSCLGVVKHCVDGEAKCHEWSAKFDGYDENKTQRKIEQWDKGPTSCAKIDASAHCMKDCQFAGKISFPIVLGYLESAPSVEEETTMDAPEEKPDTVIEGQTIPFWPDGYRWNGAAISRSYKDDEGVTHWRPFCRSFIYPINRVKDSDGLWNVHWRTKEKNNDWREFFMPTSELASTDMMAKTMASQEVFLMRTKSARNDMAEFTETIIERLQQFRVETVTYRQFGWNADYTGFVIGTKMITENGDQNVLCAPELPTNLADDFGTSGTLQQWKDNIEVLLNRPGAEPVQFALCHAMGSALVPLMESSNWHGITYAMTGDTATGKSTAAKIACGFYGSPEKMLTSTNAEGGDTFQAILRRIQLTGGVPLVLDEWTGRTPDEVIQLLYSIVTGKIRNRLGTRGQFVSNGETWYKNTIMTSNDSIQELIAKHADGGAKVEATQVRVFEYELPKGFKRAVFKDVSSNFVETHMDGVYGHACRPYIRFIIKNRKWVTKQLQLARDKMNPDHEEDNKERFYRDTVVTATVAGMIAKKIGLISFDVKAMSKWAMDHVVHMRKTRAEMATTMPEYAADFIASFQGRLVITQHYGNRGSIEMPFEQLKTSAIGRMATSDKKLFIMSSYFSRWCASHNVKPSALRDYLVAQGYIHAENGTPIRLSIRLGGGTNQPSAPQKCWSMDYEKLVGKFYHLTMVDQAAEAR